MEMICMIVIAVAVAVLSIAAARLGLVLTLSLAGQNRAPVSRARQSQMSSSQGDMSEP